MMQIDEDWIPIVLIIACVFIWVSGVWHREVEMVTIAGDVIKFGFGAVAGYMARNKLAEMVKILERENEILRMELENLRKSLSGYEQS
jgi:hypothetical protein